MTRRRVIFVGANHRYINATNAMIPAMLGRTFDVLCYGPGFVAQSVLDRGFERFVDEAGADLIVTTHAWCGGYPADAYDSYLHRYVAMLNNGRVTAAMMGDVARVCRANQRRVLCFVTEMDPHATQREALDHLAEHAGYFVGWGRGFIRTLGDPDAVKNEAYLQKKLKRSFPLGLLDGFVDRYHERFINIGHAVADNEFYWGGLGAREYDVAIPGSRYARRQASVALARKSTLRMAPMWYPWPFKLAERLGLRPYSRFLAVHAYNLAFQRVLSRTRASVTDGGANNYPVRKYFEIPAAGSLMVCWPAIGLESLGFVDGVHCVYVSSAEEAMAVARKVKDDVDRYDVIADAGQHLVLRQHSISARARQLNQVLARIGEGTFHGSSWLNGELVCDPPPAALKPR